MYKQYVALRQRKQHLIVVLKAHKIGGRLSDEQVTTFEAMYRRARSPEEQDQVTKVVHDAMEGWREGTDRFSRLRQAMNDLDELSPDDDDL